MYLCLVVLCSPLFTMSLYYESVCFFSENIFPSEHTKCVASDVSNEKAARRGVFATRLATTHSQ